VLQVRWRRIMLDKAHCFTALALSFLSTAALAFSAGALAAHHA
jgi:hypothetical protein